MLCLVSCKITSIYNQQVCILSLLSSSHPPYHPLHTSISMVPVHIISIVPLRCHLRPLLSSFHPSFLLSSLHFLLLLFSTCSAADVFCLDDLALPNQEPGTVNTSQKGNNKERDRGRRRRKIKWCQRYDGSSCCREGEEGGQDITKCNSPSPSFLDVCEVLFE